MTLTTAASAAPQAPGKASTRAHPHAVLTVIGFGALASIGLWWQNTPSVHGLGDWLTNAGRITGLLAGYGVVILVALMARIPPPSAASVRTGWPDGMRGEAGTRSA